MSHTRVGYARVHGGWYEQTLPRWLRLCHAQFCPQKTDAVTLGFRCWRA